LFSIIDSLRVDGHAVVYISHFFDEVRRVSDRFTVLRDGRNAGGGVTKEFSDEQIISMMVGREIADLYPRNAHTPGDVVLSLQGLSGVTKPSDVSIEVCAGEVVGIAGLAGAGRTELLRAVFGLDAVLGGRVTLLAHVGSASPAQRWAQGAGMLSEDRKNEGLALGMTVAENTLLTTLPPWVSPAWEARAAQSSIAQLGIKTQGPHQPVQALSGGNQQKVALARLLAHDADVYLLDEPTRGIDVASKEQIYQLIDSVAQRGKAVLIVSSYLPELLGVCDRIAVMSRGRLGPALPVAQWSQESLMHEAVGSA
jgi:ribose transport system ATP-binding protein